MRLQLKKQIETLASHEEEMQKLLTTKTKAEKTLSELTDECQKLLDDHATRIRELEAAHSVVKFDADKHVGELKAQVRQADEDLLVRVRQLSDITVAKAASDRRGVDLEARVTILDNENKTMKIQLNELLSKQEAEERKDKRRVADLREVNDKLLGFARNRRFQELVKRPHVKNALACW